MSGWAAARADIAPADHGDELTRKGRLFSGPSPVTSLQHQSSFVDHSAPGRSGRVITRVFDIVVALAALLFFLPVFLAIALAVKLTSPGPVFFSQRRLGRHGRPFACLKFRTMTPDADAQLTHLLRDNPSLSAEFHGSFKLRRDPRVTRIGRFLRATSLDELPQLLNVLLSQMSIVGPRPIVDAERPRYGELLPFVLRVKPGMTGLWQVSGRNNLSYDERVALDVHYAQHRRLRDDLLICLRTVGLLFSKAGAY